MRHLLTLILLTSLTTLTWSQSSEVTAGLASWYGDAFHGKMTANGEIYDMTDFTAAHRTLPFGTKVKVVNLLNNRAIIVRVNDRGPFKDDRIIDVSKAAAEELDFIKNGIIPVRIEVLVKGEEGAIPSEDKVVVATDTTQPSALDTVVSSSQRQQERVAVPVSSTQASNRLPSKSSSSTTVAASNTPSATPIRDIVYIQVGSYRDRTNAIRTAQTLSQSGFEIQVKENNSYYRVFFEQESKSVNDSLRLLQNQGYRDSLVRRTLVEGTTVDWQSQLLVP